MSRFHRRAVVVTLARGASRRAADGTGLSRRGYRSLILKPRTNRCATRNAKAPIRVLKFTPLTW